MDTTFIEAYIKQLCRIDLMAKVLHNFLIDLLEDLLEDLPGGMAEFAGRDTLSMSYQLDQDEVDEVLKTFVEHAAWLLDQFEGEAPYCEFESFARRGTTE